jgi:hypothetical protein
MSAATSWLVVTLVGFSVGGVAIVGAVRLADHAQAFDRWFLTAMAMLPAGLVGAVGLLFA